MLHVITGGSGSGKSEYAEQVAVRIAAGGLHYYLATMKKGGREGKQRIERHRRQRMGKGFCTLEQERDVDQIDIPLDAVVLLECMSNLLANEMFDGTERQEEPVSVRVIQQIDHLLDKCRALILVTNDVFCDGMEYDPFTEAYIRELGAVNRALGNLADEVTEVVYGIPVPVCRKEGDEKWRG